MTNKVVQYTTPTFHIKFKTIDPADIAEAYLVFKLAGSTILMKDITYADVLTDALEWTLSQEDCGKFPVNTMVRVYCDWITQGGLRGRSARRDYVIDETGVAEVIGNV